ncbi:hypothetical protein [Prescottella equi]|uniref:hypothetical protein n=1 Tax=Rhodococcus hoagii TaxID=43767 RepID=UPI0012F8F02C|nr:hypothetical protein [Prescottella equi]
MTVSDLIVREMDYYGEIKPERQYRAAVSVKSTEGETPISSLSFKAVAADGTTMGLSLGGESDEIDASGTIPAGSERKGMVTWTGAPGITITEISLLPDGLFAAATWTVPGAPASAPPSRMSNHDEIIARTSTPAAAAVSTVEAPEPAVTTAPVVTTAPPAVRTYEEPAPTTAQWPIGMTGAPGHDSPAPMVGKTVDYCMDQSMYQRGTTKFTDGTTGWTEQCAYGG